MFFIQRFLATKPAIAQTKSQNMNITRARTWTDLLSKIILLGLKNY